MSKSDRVVAVKCEEVVSLRYGDKRGKTVLAFRIILHTECDKASRIGQAHRAVKKLIQVMSKSAIDQGIFTETPK